MASNENSQEVPITAIFGQFLLSSEKNVWTSKEHTCEQVFLERTFLADVNEQYGQRRNVCKSGVIGESGGDVCQKRLMMLKKHLFQ